MVYECTSGRGVFFLSSQSCLSVQKKYIFQNYVKARQNALHMLLDARNQLV